ncbi:MAG: DUF3352 domain-containing protein [Austwickia sp.]|nr:DUF3352 domain-containing protein [Austwickia sp.]MBK8437900.1 DUF3352 domain-containing protein [Austwickia sp.]MBK9100201.1 DUF3352 domain-containing protein [Austwickia sp.]
MSHEPGAAAAAGGRKRGIVIGAVGVSLLAVGGVAAIAGPKLFSSGTSQDGQPATVLPIDSLAYYRLDMDPSTAQKVAAFRLFDKLPDAKKVLGDSNPKKALFELIKKDDPKLKDIDYTNDIDPWLGDRLGLAILAPAAGGKDPMVVAAVQVKDEAKANAGIAKLKEKTGDVDLSLLTDAAKASAGGNPFGRGLLPPDPDRGFATYESDPPPVSVEPVPRPSMTFESPSTATITWEPTTPGAPGSASVRTVSAGGAARGVPVPADTATPTWPSAPSSPGTPGTSEGPSGTRQESVHWYRNGYMLVTAKKDEQAVRAAIDKGQLVGNQDFAKDMSDLGEQGVMSGWTDTPKLVRALSSTSDAPMSSATRELFEMNGRQAGAVRFDPAFVEIVSLTRDTGLNISHPPMRDLNKLPTDTAAFMSLTGGADMMKAWWPKFEKLLSESSPNWRDQLTDFEKQTGIAIPGDLETLMGNQIDVVVSEKSVKDKMPVLGARLFTDSAKAEKVLGNLERLWKSQSSSNGAPDTFGLNRRTEGDVVYVGSTPSYRDELVSGGKLTDEAALKEALPNLDKQHAAFYVNLDKIEQLYLDGMPSGQQKDLLQSLKAVGMSSVKNGDRYDSVTRLVVN